MRAIKVVLMSIALILIYGCSHLIDESGVNPTSDSRPCLLEAHSAGLAGCNENVVNGQYAVTDNAVVHRDWQFFCGGNYDATTLVNQSGFNSQLKTVPNFLGQTKPPSPAVFRSTKNAGYSLLSMADSAFDPFSVSMLAYAYCVDEFSSNSVAPGYSIDLQGIASASLVGRDTKHTTPAKKVNVDKDINGVRDHLKPNSTKKPNILLIVADDLGYNDLAINNDNTEIDTPNMDQIARDGVRFTRHYAAAVCSPGRAALLTGIYPERLGYLPNGLGISPEIVTLPERLKEAGYTTWHIGKWHIGDLERTAWPDQQGFDHWFGFLNQWRLAGVHTAGGEMQLTVPTYQDPWLESDSAPGRKYPGHLENILTDKAINVLSKLNRAQAPWFLNLWFMAPHDPVQPASEFAKNYPDTPAGRYRALVSQLDYNIGRVIAHLGTIGALQNTIIVVVSDNGGTNKALNNNAPFFGTKTTLTEGGMRTPLIIRWPEASINKQVFSDTVAIEDIYPSLLEAIGVAPPDDLDGDSFYQSVRKREPATPKARFWDHTMTKDWVSYAALSADGRWRLYQPVPFWGSELELQLIDLEFDPTGAQPVLPIPLAPTTHMREGYRAWYKDVHTVKTTYTAGINGSGVLTGMDFLRTPGFGTYTFGIGVPHGFQGSIATQAGVWELRRTGNTVTAQFGDLSLSGDIQNSESCHSVVISGNFSRQVQFGVGPDLMTLALYIDGVEAQSGKLAATLRVDDPTIETIIGEPGMATGTGATIPPPVILNTALNSSSPWTLELFSKDLCENN